MVSETVEPVAHVVQAVERISWRDERRPHRDAGPLGGRHNERLKPCFVEDARFHLRARGDLQECGDHDRFRRGRSRPGGRPDPVAKAEVVSQGKRVAVAGLSRR